MAVNTVFSYFLPRPEDGEEDLSKRKGYAKWFIASYPVQEFEHEDKLLWHYLNFVSKLNVNISEKSTQVFIKSEMPSIIQRDRIKVVGTEQLTYDDPLQKREIEEATGRVLRDTLRDLKLEDGTVDEFILGAKQFTSDQLTNRTVQAMEMSQTIMFEGYNGLSGAEAATEYLHRETAALREMYSDEKLGELEESKTSTERKFVKVCDFGILCVDKDTKGCYTGQLFGIEAPAGKGKTRMAIGAPSYQAAVYNKKNVLYVAIEQSKEEIESMFVARHCYTLYKKLINADDILKDLVPNEYKQMVEAARLDLFESGKYGKIRILGSTQLYLETFIEKLKTQDSLHGPFDVIVIDYMCLIEQEPSAPGVYRKTLQDFQVWAKAYKWFKRYCLNYGKVGIAINQLNRTGAQKAEQDMDTDITDAQGGMEVYRSTDYNIVITCTDEMEAQGKRRLSNPKKRGTKGMQSQIVDTYLCSCVWISRTQQVA